MLQNAGCDSGSDYGRSAQAFQTVNRFPNAAGENPELDPLTID
jgi:hypothetical protein